MGRLWIYSVVTIFCLISLSFSAPPLLPISFYLCTSHLLLNKIRSTDFSMWSHLTLIQAEASLNWIVTCGVGKKTKNGIHLIK